MAPPGTDSRAGPTLVKGGKDMLPMFAFALGLAASVLIMVVT